MKRSSKGLSRRTRVKPSNGPRRKKEFARCYHSVERVEFVKGLPCCICERVPSENAHTRGDGAGRKAGYETIAPMCSFDHAELHVIGIASFTMKHAVDLDAEARRTEELWQGRNRQSALTPIGDVVSSVWPASDAGAA